jgi:hypothetical protein
MSVNKEKTILHNTLHGFALMKSAPLGKDNHHRLGCYQDVELHKPSNEHFSGPDRLIFPAYYAASRGC